MNAIITALPIALLAAVAPIGTAHAVQDWKGYAGVNCMSQDNTAPIRRSAVLQTALANTGTSTITVFCPVVRDEPVGGDNKVAAVAVRVRNRNSTVTGSCEFSSHDITGTRIDSKSAPAPFGETTLQLGPVNAHNWGSYVLTCQLPGRDVASGLQSYIVNYRIEETP